MHQLDPQLHIYDDLDTTTSSPTGQQRQQAASKEIEPHRLSVESVIGRGKFLALLIGLPRRALARDHHTSPARYEQSAKYELIKGPLKSPIGAKL